MLGYLFFPYQYHNILNISYSSYQPAYENGTQCPEKLAYKIQTPRNYTKKAYNIQNKAKV